MGANKMGDIVGANKMGDIVYSKESPLVLIDTSYYIFYRYNATLKWWEFQKKGETIDFKSLHTNDIFVSSFKKHVIADIAKLRKRWSVGEKNVLFCLDVPRDTIWRNEVYPVYKSTREQASTFNREIFPLFYKFLENELKYSSVTGKSLEADDVIYITSKYLANVQDFRQRIYVISNDNDYLQMRGGLVEIHNMSGKSSDLAKRSVGDPRQDLLIKVLRGDPSDNISQVCAKIGVKTAAKLAQLSDAEILAWASAKGAECLANYMRNRLLISFEHIPQDLAQAFLNKYTFKPV